MLALSAAVCGGMDASAVWQMDEVNVVGERYDCLLYTSDAADD